jgi:hypothetical protein
MARRAGCFVEKKQLIEMVILSLSKNAKMIAPSKCAIAQIVSF